MHRLSLMRMSKQIAVFIDGTAFRSDAESLSNVGKLCMATVRGSARGQKQLVFYHRGVGSGIGTGRTSKLLDRALGGMFGSGLGAIITEAYRQIVLNYEDGDEIYLFGWSRGAHAVRRLVEVMRTLGLMPITRMRDIDLAVELTMARPRGPQSNPESPESYALRDRFGAQSATSLREQHWRRRNGSDAAVLEIAYIGLWDTVGAIGLPLGLNRIAKMHSHLEAFDAQLTSMVKSARHAVAIDERSAFFPSSPFDNFDALTQYNSASAQDYLQKWFPGGHAAVGGATPDSGIGALTLNWIADGARAAGFEFDRTVLDDLSSNRAVSYEDAMRTSKGIFGMKPFMRARGGGLTPDEISPAAIDLFHNDPRYRTKALCQALEPLTSDRA